VRFAKFVEAEKIKLNSIKPVALRTAVKKLMGQEIDFV
jgi:hypothetical protein